MNLEEFAGHCKVDVQDGVLTASCVVRDEHGQCHKLTKTVDLRPAATYVAERLATWHRSQHGLESGDHVQGFWDDVSSYATKAVKVVADVASNKTVQALYNKAAPYIEQAVRKNVPGGDTVMDIATKAHDLYDRARKNHPDAVAAVKKLVGIAETGHPQAAETLKAKFAVNVMKQASAMTQAKEQGIPAHLATAPAPGEHMHLRDHRHGLYNLGVTVTSGDQVGWGVDRMTRDQLTRHAIARAKAGTPHGNYGRRGGASDHRANPGGWHGNRAAAPHPWAKPHREPDPAPDSDDNQDDQADDGDDTATQGRFWQHPYRKTAQRIVDMRDHAGVGLAARELYNRGLGRGNTDWTDVATEALGHL